MAKTVLSKDLIPLSEFRAKASSLISSLKKQPDKAIVITQNGRAAAVVLSVEECEEMRLSFLEFRQLAEGLLDLRKGKTKLVDFKEGLEKLHKEEALSHELQEVAE